MRFYVFHGMSKEMEFKRNSVSSTKYYNDYSISDTTCIFAHHTHYTHFCIPQFRKNAQKSTV